MPGLLTPRRRRGSEILDDPSIDARTRRRSLRDVACANALFGGTRAVLRELDERAFGAAHGCPLTLLDVGTGIGDIPVRARATAARRGIALTVLGLDASLELVRAAQRSGVLAVCGDALELPFADASVDIVICSQLLHHFEGDDAVALIREMDRVARRCVIVSDLRRSWLAAAGIWLASYPLRFHAVSRHDGVVSVLRGFTRDELTALVRAATGTPPITRDRLGFRTTAVWLSRAACDAHPAAR